MEKGTCGTTGTTITCVATQEPCPSNTASPAHNPTQCLSVTVTYHYNESPLFPELPGLGLVTPSTISSTNVVQLGTVS